MSILDTFSDLRRWVPSSWQFRGLIAALLFVTTMMWPVLFMTVSQIVIMAAVIYYLGVQSHLIDVIRNSVAEGELAQGYPPLRAVQTEGPPTTDKTEDATDVESELDSAEAETR